MEESLYCKTTLDKMNVQFPPLLSMLVGNREAVHSRTAVIISPAFRVLSFKVLLYRAQCIEELWMERRRHGLVGVHSFDQSNCLHIIY